jgi:hypothetical protein
LILAISLASACASPAGDTPPSTPTPTAPQAGLEGLVLIGPACPVIGKDTPCPDEPYQAILVVTESGTGRKVATVQSGPDGLFRVEIPPGEYLLEPQSPNPGAPPFAEPQTVTVEAGRFTSVQVLYESGIR